MSNIFFHDAFPAKLLMLVLFVGSILTGCKGDEDEVLIHEHQVNFFASSQVVSENDDELIIKITLDRPAAISGIIKIQLAANNLNRFVIAPAAVDGIITLPVVKDQNSVQFTLIPSDNTIADGDEAVTFTVKEVSDGFVIGTAAQDEVLIEDDEASIKANFLLNVGSIRENKAYGLDVVILLSDFPQIDGKVIVTYESAATYGEDFVTEPAAVNGKIEVSTIGAEYDYMYFRIRPLDDQVVDGDMPIKLTLSSATAGFGIGDSKTLDLDLIDDESFAVYQVEDVRAMYTGESIILDNMYLEATVTSAKDNVGNTMTFVEDETGGIPLRLIFANSFQRGDRIRVNLGYGLLKEQNGVLEVQQVSEADKVGTSPLSYKVMTISALLNANEDLEGRLVKLTGVTFPEADGLNKMRGDRTISDGTNTIIVRTLQHASFGDQIVPGGVVDVGGILTEVNGAFILYPQLFTEDISVQ